MENVEGSVLLLISCCALSSYNLAIITLPDRLPLDGQGLGQVDFLAFCRRCDEQAFSCHSDFGFLDIVWLTCSSGGVGDKERSDGDPHFDE